MSMQFEIREKYIHQPGKTVSGLEFARVVFTLSTLVD